MQKIIALYNWFKGKKTYFVSILGFVASVGIVASNIKLVINGQLDWNTFINDPSTTVFLVSLGLGGLRAGIANK